MSLAADTVDVVTTCLPVLSSDLIIEIFTAADWRTVLSMRKVSSLWYELSKTWSIWAAVVMRETLPQCDRPVVCFLEKPLKKYTSPELETLLKRWKIADHALKGGACGTPHVKSFAISQGLAHHLLLPGGRWFVTIRFEGLRALYYDLDAAVPKEHTLFPSQYPRPSPATQPCLNHDLNSDLCIVGSGFKVFMAFAFFDEWISAWIVQVWKIESAEEEDIPNFGLRATLQTAMKFRTGGRAASRVTCRSLTADFLALSIGDDNDMSAGYVSLVEWQALPVDAGFDFKRAMVPNAGDQHESSTLILIPRQPRLLVFTNTSVFLDDFSLVPHRQGQRTLEEARDDDQNRRRKLLLSNSNSIRQAFSRPYVLVRNPSVKASPITIRVVALNKYHGRLLGMEVEIPSGNPEHSQANCSARHAHLGALPTIGLTEHILLRYGHATARYRTARHVQDGIATYNWSSHWEIGKHNVQKLPALETLSDWKKFKCGEPIDMDEGTARYICCTPDYDAPMVHVIDFAT